MWKVRLPVASPAAMRTSRTAMKTFPTGVHPSLTAMKTSPEA
jgi:hypothetical protein